LGGQESEDRNRRARDNVRSTNLERHWQWILGKMSAAFCRCRETI